MFIRLPLHCKFQQFWMVYKPISKISFSEKIYLKQNVKKLLYSLHDDLTNSVQHDSWFSTWSWISMTEFFVIMNLFTTTEKYQLIYIFRIKIMWNESYMNILIIIYEHFEHLIMLNSFFYLVLILSVLFTIQLHII